MKEFMDSLTFGERQRIHELLQSGGESRGETASEIVSAASAVLLAPVEGTGFERSLSRVALQLSYLLLFSPSEESREDARSALLYLVKEADAIPDPTPVRGLDDDLYVLHRAWNRISERTGEERISIAHPALIDDHVLGVETALREFIKVPCAIPISQLKARVLDRLDELAAVAPATLLAEIRHNVLWLAQTAEETSDDRVSSWAAAALQYLSASNFVIPEKLGPVALLDDLYATYLAAVNCRAPRAALISALDSVARMLPLLDLMVLKEGDSRRPLSEYLRCNLALVLKLATSDRQDRKVIHLPVIGGTPLLLSFLAATFVVFQERSLLSKLPEFEKGTRLRLTQGGKTAVAEFQGYEEHDGVMRMVLSDGSSTGRFPLTPQLLSAISVTSKGKLRGVGKVRSSIRDIPITPLDFLFDMNVPLRLDDMGCRVIFVSNSMKSVRDRLRNTYLCGFPLVEALPVGRLQQADDEEPEGWSARWADTPPILAVSSSLREACEYVETNPDASCRLILIEDAGRWSEDADLIPRLARAGCSVAAFKAFGDDSDLSALTNNGFKHVRWDVEELEQLSWPRQAKGVSAAEARVQNATRAEIMLTALDSKDVDELWFTLDAARREHEQEGEYEAKSQLALNAAWLAFTRVSRWFLPFSDSPTALYDLLVAAKRLQDAGSSGQVSASVAERFLEASESATRLHQSLELDNPKYRAFSAIVGEDEKMVVLARNEFAAHEYRSALRRQPDLVGVEVLLASRVPDAGVERGTAAFIPGWYKASMMSSLLDPPVASRVGLALWGFERVHHSRWAEQRLRVHTVPGIAEEIGGNFRRRTRRTTLSIQLPTPVSASPDEILESLELETVRVRAAYLTRRHDEGGERAELVESYVVAFRDGLFAFLPAEGNAQVVTDLLRGDPDEVARSKLQNVSVSELSEGDLVLFHTGSEPDAIRAQADGLMNEAQPGSALVIRELADMWRQALVEYKQTNLLSALDLTARLAAHGCCRDAMTIRKWLNDSSFIAPQTYRAEIPAILELTGDPVLKNGLKRCIDAVRKLRGEHLRASASLAKTLLSKASDELGTRRVTGDFGAGLFVAEVRLVDKNIALVDARQVRRLHSTESHDQPQNPGEETT